MVTELPGMYLCIIKCKCEKITSIRIILEGNITKLEMIEERCQSCTVKDAINPPPEKTKEEEVQEILEEGRKTE